jgi:membrane protein DedA with SNARE-associated domain
VNWVADQVFLVLAALFVRYGVAVVFVAALAEATVGVGLVVPGIVMIFLAGAYAHDQGSSLLLLYLVANVGTLLGDSLSYGLGRWGGDWLRSTRFSSVLWLGEAMMSGRARWLIPFYHFNSVTRTLGPFGAGALRMPLWVWLPLDTLGAVLANTAYMGAGVILGRAVLTPDGRLQEHPALRVGLFVAALFWVWLVRREWQRTRALTVREQPVVRVERGE